METAAPGVVHRLKHRVEVERRWFLPRRELSKRLDLFRCQGLHRIHHEDVVKQKESVTPDAAGSGSDSDET